MKKAIIITTELTNAIETNAKIEKLLADARKRKIAELVKMGIDKTIASIMVDTCKEYGIRI